MTRRELFELFHRYFDAEEARYESLTKRASLYLSVVSGLSLFAGLKLDEMNKLVTANWQTLALAGIGGVLVLGCLGATILSVRVYKYRDVCDIEELIVEIEESKYDEEDVYSVLLASLADATRNNREINDQRARYLQWAASFLGLAVVTFLATTVVAIWLH